ncbi:MAG: glutathione S-transferase N-terminal domain-containing protein [Pseudomonadales bacterium]
MLDLHFAPTPNGWKITIMLEECGLPYNVKLLNIGAGAQFEDDFLALNPNAKMPVLVDHDAEGGALSIAESGAILQYLAEQSGQFLPTDTRSKYRVLQWVHWQMANLGPIGGQVSHFVNYAAEGNEYAKDRYLKEYDRLLAVMNYQLEQSEYLAGDYSIADMASFPWLLPYKRYGFDLAHFPHLKRWYDTLKQRPALRRGVDVGKDLRPSAPPDDATRSMLFGQDSSRYKK